MTGNCSVLYTGEEMRGSAMMHIDQEAEDADTASVPTSLEDSWCVGAAQGSRILRDLASRRSAIREREQRGAVVDHDSPQSSFVPSTSVSSMRGSRRGSSRGRSSSTRRGAARTKSRGVKSRGKCRGRGQYHSSPSPQPSSSFGEPRQARVVLNRLEDTGVHIENNGIYQIPFSTSPTVPEEVNYDLHSEYICSSPEMRNEEDFDDIECPDLRGIYHEDHCSPLLYDNEEPPPRRHIKYHVHFQYDGDDDSSEGNPNNCTSMSDFQNLTDTLTTNNEQPGTSSVVACDTCVSTSNMPEGSDTCVSTSDNANVDEQKYPFHLEMRSHNAQTSSNSVPVYPPPLYEDISDAEEIVSDSEDIPVVTVEDSEDNCEKDPLEEQLHRLLDTPSPTITDIKRREEDNGIEVLPDSSGIQKPQAVLARRVSAPAQLSPSPPKRTEPRTRKLSWPAGNLDEDTDSTDRSSAVNYVAIINKLKLARDGNRNWQIISNNRDNHTNDEGPSTSRYHSDDREVISEESALQSNIEPPSVSGDSSEPSTPQWNPKIVHVTSQALWFRNAIGSSATSTASSDQVNRTVSECSDQDIRPTFSAGIIAPEIEEIDQNEVQTQCSSSRNLPNISITHSAGSAANQNVISKESQPFHASEPISNENCKIVLASPTRKDLSEKNKETGDDKVKSLPEANYATINLTALVLDEANNNVNSTLCQDPEVTGSEQNEDVAEENVEMNSDEGNQLTVTAAATQMEPVDDCSSFIMDTQSDDDDEDALKIDEDRISCSEVETSLSAEKPSECEEGNACKAETSCDTPSKHEATAVVDSYATDCGEDLEDDELTVTDKPEDAAECTKGQMNDVSDNNQSVQPECPDVSNSGASLRDNGDREYMKDGMKDVRKNERVSMGERIVQSLSVVLDPSKRRETNSGVRNVEVVKLSGQTLESGLMLTNKDKVTEHSVTVVDSSSALPKRDNIVVDKTTRDSGTVSNDVHTRTSSSVDTEAAPGSSMLCEKTPVVSKAATREFQKLLITFEKTELGNCLEQLGSLNSVVVDNAGSDSNQKSGATNDIESDSSKTSGAIKVKRKSRTFRKKSRHDHIKLFKASAQPPWMYANKLKVTTTSVDSSGAPLSVEIMVIPECSETTECEASDQAKPECEQVNKMPSSEKKRVGHREEVPSDSKKHHLPSSSESSDDGLQEANSENNLEEDEKGLGTAKKRLRKRKRRFKRKKREGSSNIMEEVSQHILDTQMQEKERRLAQEIPRFNWLEEKIKNGGAVPVTQPAKKAKRKDSDGSLEEKSSPPPAPPPPVPAPAPVPVPAPPPAPAGTAAAAAAAAAAVVAAAAASTVLEGSLEIRKVSEADELESKGKEDTSVNKTTAASSSPDAAKKPEQVRAPVIVSMSALKSNPETINPVLQHLTSHGDLEVTLASSTACSSSSSITPPLAPVTIQRSYSSSSPKAPPPPLIAVRRQSGSDMPLATLVPVQSHSRVVQRRQSATATSLASIVPTTCSLSEVPATLPHRLPSVSSSSSVPVQHSRHGPPSEGSATWRYPPAWPVGETIRPAPGKPEKRVESVSSHPPPQLPFSMVAPPPPPFYLSEPVATMARHATTSFDTGLGLGLSVQQQHRYPQRQKQHPHHQQQPVPKATLPAGPPQPSPLFQGPYHRYLLARHAAAHQMRSQPLKPAAQYPRHGLHPNAMFHPPSSLPAYGLPINPITQPPALTPLESSSARLRLASAPKDVPSGSNHQPYHHSTVNSSLGQSDLPPPLTVVPEAQLGSDVRYKQPEPNYHAVHDQRSDREENQHKGGVGVKSASDGARNMSKVFYLPEESRTRSSRSSSPHHDAVINCSSPMQPDSTSPQAKGSLPSTPTSPKASVGTKRSSSSPLSGEDCPRKKIGLPPPAWPLRIRGSIKRVEVLAASGDKLNEPKTPSVAHSSSVVSLLASKSNMSASTSDGNDQDESPMDLSMCKRKSEDSKCETLESTSVSKELATTAISQSTTVNLASVLEQDSTQETRGTKEHSRLWHHLMSGPSSTRDPSSREASPKVQNLVPLASPENEPVIRSFDNNFRERQIITTEHVGLSQSREQNISVTGITTDSVISPITSQSREQHVLVPRSTPETIHLKDLTVTKTVMEPVKIPPSGHTREQSDILIKRTVEHSGAAQVRDRQSSVTDSTEPSGIHRGASLREHLVSASGSAVEPKRTSVCGGQQLSSHLVSATRNSTEVAGHQTGAPLREHVSVPKSANIPSGSSLSVQFRDGHYRPVPSAVRETILSSQDVQSRQQQAVPMPLTTREVQRQSQNVHFREHHRAPVPDHPLVPRNQMFRDHQFIPIANSIQDPSGTSHDPRLRNPASLQPVWPQNPETHTNSQQNSGVVYQRGFEMPRHPQVPARFHFAGNGVHSAMPRYNIAPEQMYRGSQFPLEAMYFRHHREPHAGNAAIASAPQGRNFFSQQLSPVAAITPEMSAAANSPQKQKASPSSYRCHNCHEAEAKFMCSACHAARYCSTPCQIFPVREKENPAQVKQGNLCIYMEHYICLHLTSTSLSLLFPSWKHSSGQQLKHWHSKCDAALGGPFSRLSQNPQSVSNIACKFHYLDERLSCCKVCV
ncbi:mucin-4 [Anabrus simplex]|uniref:mucin-4 n=1 Tax=Anabrus simplex TaxID=316456 RepID=UPI0035A2E8CD